MILLLIEAFVYKFPAEPKFDKITVSLLGRPVTTKSGPVAGAAQASTDIATGRITSTKVTADLAARLTKVGFIDSPDYSNHTHSD